MIAQTQGLSKQTATTTIEIVFNSISEALAKDDKVELRGFGTFKASHRDERVSRNPRTGEVVQVPAKKIPRFKAGKVLREMVDGD